jgi:hypothetical protein
MIRHHNRIARAAALTLALAAIAASPASATPPPASPAPCSDVCPAAVTTHTPATSALCGDVCSGHGYGSVGVPSTVVRTISSDSGFDWGDAGIGAGGALGLVLAATGGTLLLAHRRTQSDSAS